MGMWVQLKQIQYFPVQGIQTCFQPGDWVEVGKQLALRWIAEGAAHVPGAKKVAGLEDPEMIGIVVTANPEVGKAALTSGNAEGQLGIEYGEPRLPWAKTVLWDGALKLRLEMLPIGFELLETWQIAVPIWSYEKLACHVGDAQERNQTQKIVRELRVPLYDTRLMFLKRCGDVKKFMAVWAEERAGSNEPKLALLRALYRTKPLVLALPTTWTGGHV